MLKHKTGFCKPLVLSYLYCNSLQKLQSRIRTWIVLHAVQSNKTVPVPESSQFRFMTRCSQQMNRETRVGVVENKVTVNVGIPE